jgi:methyl-accepting chemotaxis protein
MKIGTKILLGFLCVLVIAGALGGLAITNMLSVKGDSTDLASEYVPEVVLASQIERETRLAMMDLRSYGLIGDEKLLESGRHHLEEVERVIGEASKLAANASKLTALPGAINELTAKLAEYRKQIDATQALERQKSAIRERLDTAGKILADKSEDFFSGQVKKANADVDAGKEPEALKERIRKLEAGEDILQLIAAARVDFWKKIADRRFEELERAQVPLEKTDEIFKILMPITRVPSDVDDLKLLQGAVTAYAQGIKDMHANAQAMAAINVERAAASAAFAKIAEELSQKGLGHAKDVADRAQDSLGRSSYVMIIGLVIAAVLGLTLAFLITRGIVNALLRTVDDLGNCSAQTAAASQQVASGSQALADGTSKTAAALEETSASMEEMSSLVQQTTQNTASASALAQKARETGELGATAMSDLAKAIAEIKANADQTAKIVKTIDEIAFQTNLLALNAAVEAARAGDAGKGFAVVAEEVRNLAQRAGQAARTTSELIEKSVKSAESGVSLSHNVSQVVGDMTGASRKVSDLVGEIAASAKEIAQGIDQVGKAVRQMDQVTQGNAASAEENSAVGEEMSAQAQTLNQLVIDLEGMVRTRRPEMGGGPVQRQATRPKTLMAVPMPARQAQIGGPSQAAKKAIPFDDDQMNDATLSRF